jgi:membrane associated rhomboid family serine protease
MDTIIQILAWLIVIILLTVFPASLESSRQRYRIIPSVTYSIIIINVIIYLSMLIITTFWNPLFYQTILNTWGCRPYDILNPLSAANPIELIHRYITLITYQFLHGGFFHLLGNMYCLHVFGPGVEMGQNILFRGRDRRPYNSHYPFLIFYLLCGIGSAFAHIGLGAFGNEAMANIVLVGASGGISGVLAGYMLGLWKDYNKIRLYVLYYIPFNISVNFYIVYWILLQLSLFVIFGSQSSVSYAGHIGGFVTGLILWMFVCPWVDIIVKTRPRTWFRKYRLG